MITTRLIEQIDVVQGFAPVDLKTGANSGDYVSLKNYSGCLIVFISGIGAAGEDPTVTVRQATAVAGTAVKDLLFTEWYKKIGATALSAVSQFTKVTQTAAATAVDTDAAENESIYVIDITADMLDVDGGFDCIVANVADVGATAQLGTLLMIPYGARQARATMLGSITD